jgi:uncharacterized protein YjbI with pentapeptide repeats
MLRRIFYVFLFLIIVIVFIWSGYQLPILSGFGDKVWWDWMQLIIVPIILASGGLLLNTTFQATERKRAQDTLMDNIFQSYLDDMANLLIEKELQKELDKNNDKEPPPVVTVARARTVTTLRSLDKERRSLCLNFLQETKLIIGEKGRLFVNVQFGDIDLGGAWFSEQANLSGIDLEYANLSGASLQGANLSGAKLRGVDLSRTNLQGSNLSGANLSEANLSGVFLQKANLSRTNLQGSNLSGADLQGANLSGAGLRGVDLSGAVLMGANLSGASLWQANLSNVQYLTDKQLARARMLGDATMPDRTKYDEKWEERLLSLKSRSQLIEILKIEGDLSKLDLKYADLSKLDLSKVGLSGLNLHKANLQEANLSGANLSETNLSGASLQKANLSGANLREVDLTRAFLIGADLSGAILSKADLSGASLWLANLTDEQLAQAESLEGALMPNGTTYDEEIEASLTALRKMGDGNSEET